MKPFLFLPSVFPSALPSIIFILFAFVFGVFIYSEGVKTVSSASSAEIDYVLLEPIPDGGGGSRPTDRVNVANFPEYVNNMIRLIIGISAFLAVLMITIGGFKYMIGGASPSAKSEGKEQIENAILGFLLLLGCYFILSIINPDLLKINLTPTKVGISAPISTKTRAEPIVGTYILTKPTTCSTSDSVRTNCKIGESRVTTDNLSYNECIRGAEGTPGSSCTQVLPKGAPICNTKRTVGDATVFSCDNITNSNNPETSKDLVPLVPQGY